MSELGIRKINNAVFVRADDDVMKKLIICKEYITYGYPTKKMVNELVRKRGYLRKGGKKEPITNNVLIEELLGDIEGSSVPGCICLEDIIDNIYNCHKSDANEVFQEVRKVLWPFMLGSLKETIEDANIAHDAHGRDVRKKNTMVVKGGYVGFMASEINEYIKALI